MLLSVAVLIFLVPGVFSAIPLLKRDVCQNGTYTTSSGVVFDTLCDMYWNGHDLQVVFAVDFTSCLDQCAAWNTDNVQPCVGVAFGRTKPGPVEGTFTCYFKWDMSGNSTGPAELDSGRLQGETNASYTSSSYSQASDQCPSLNKTVQTSPSGHEFDIACNNDFPGGDMHIIYTPDFSTCIDGCASWNTIAPCEAAVWNIEAPGPSNGYACYFKWNAGNAFPNVGAQSAKLVKGPDVIGAVLGGVIGVAIVILASWIIWLRQNFLKMHMRMVADYLFH